MVGYSGQERLQKGTIEVKTQDNRAELADMQQNQQIKCWPTLSGHPQGVVTTNSPVELSATRIKIKSRCKLVLNQAIKIS